MHDKCSKISYFSRSKRFAARIFDGLRGEVEVAGQTVDSCWYARKYDLLKKKKVSLQIIKHARLLAIFGTNNSK